MSPLPAPTAQNSTTQGRIVNPQPGRPAPRVPPSAPPSRPSSTGSSSNSRSSRRPGFLSYFLIVGDFIRYGHERGIACRARGSAAGSIVTYLLEISNVCPIRYGLLFERFLNPERVNPPDIDIDFADDRRADVIEYVRQKYGREAVAQIITFGTMGAKSVVRDVGRVMGLTYGECDRLAKMIPFDLKMTLEKALKQSPELKQAYENEEVTRELIDTAFILEDLTRNASVHAAGVVIGDQPLVNLLPLKQDEDGAIVTQYAMGPVGDLGLLKMDFLGLKTLTVIRNTCEMVKQTRGIEVPIDDLPLDDAKTYDLLNKANTLGVFQLESGGMRDLCRKFQITSIEHITALIALYRPGPMELIPEFIKRRHGEIRIEYEHPLLEPICRETYGIMIYQEQVMQATQVLAGLHARPGGFAAARDGQEEGRGNGQAARELRQGLRRGEPDPGGQGQPDLRPAGEVCRLRLQQVARRRLRHGRLSDGLPEGELPGRVLLRHDDQRHGGHGQAQPIHRRGARHGHRGAAAGCEREPGVFRAGAKWGGRPACPRAGVPPAQSGLGVPPASHHRRTGGTPVLLWPSASGWRPSRALGRWRWRRSSRRGAKAGNSIRWPTCASGWMAAR